MAVTVKELSKELKVDPQTTRRFLRSTIKHDRGERWYIDENDIPRIKLLYAVKKLGIDNAIDLLSEK